MGSPSSRDGQSNTDRDEIARWTSSLKAPSLSDLAETSLHGEHSIHGERISGSNKYWSGHWTVQSDFSMAASMEALRLDQGNEREGSHPERPGVRLVQQPIVPELIPTPEGKPDPKWKDNSPEKSPKKAPEPEQGSRPKAPSMQASVSPPKPPAIPNAEQTNGIKVVEAPPMGNRVPKIKPAGDQAQHEDAELGREPEHYQSWATPRVALVLTGNQHGYIEPCGCTGLERQKGGVARRFSFLESLRESGWTLVPMDVGNQVRRYGRQAEIKLHQSVRALSEMRYQAIGFGPEDIRLGAGELLAVAAGESPEETMYVSANVVLIDPELMPQQKVVESGGVRIGVTSILDPESLETEPSEELLIEEMVASTKKSIEKLNQLSADYNVLLFFGEEKSAKKLVQDVDGFDLVVVSGGYGEPTYQANAIPNSKTKMIVTGNKGMYAGIVGLFDRDQESPKGTKTENPLEMRYARVPLTHEFADAPAMRALMKDYQDQLRDVGFGGLGLLPPIPHPSGRKFVGSEVCGKCHTEAMDVWENSAHAIATESIIKPSENRGDVVRHFDPECISCHVTGWNPQSYYPYASGYLSLESTEHLTGNGCENCHGPGAEHAAAEGEGSSTSGELREQLRMAMQLPLEKAREKCMECHDLDNSPDFHEPDAFLDIYWPEVEHSGVQ